MRETHITPVIPKDERTDRALSVDQKRSPAELLPLGRLEAKLRSGARVCVIEARPPDGPDLAPLSDAAARLGHFVDAIQLTDMPFATPHVANLAAGSRLAREGHEVVLNVTCRDRNLIAQQGLLLGAASLGIQNVFCIRGDLPEVGDHPTSRGVFELTGLELIRLARSLRDEGRYRSGRTITPRPALFVGAAVAPHATYGDGAVSLTRQKVLAGADFLVTQPVFDAESLAEYHSSVAPALGRTHLLAGIGAVTTLPALHSLLSAPELELSEEFVRRFEEATPEARGEFGMRHALDLVDFALDIGVDGVLVYPFAATFEQTLELVEAIRVKLDAAPARPTRVDINES